MPLKSSIDMWIQLSAILSFLPKTLMIDDAFLIISSKKSCTVGPYTYVVAVAGMLWFQRYSPLFVVDDSSILIYIWNNRPPV